uniref:Uncharacterized protein n=1 Tax=Cacopsylla melanoneura TaxID=428564 RepID=A0A8D8WSM6_9HEMI
MMESIPQCKRFRGIDSLEYSILPSFYLAVKEDIFLACFQTSYLSKLTRFLPRASTPPVFIVESSAPPISLLWSNLSVHGPSPCVQIQIRVLFVHHVQFARRL